MQLVALCICTPLLIDQVLGVLMLFQGPQLLPEKASRVNGSSSIVLTCSPANIHVLSNKIADSRDSKDRHLPGP